MIAKFLNSEYYNKSLDSSKKLEVIKELEVKLLESIEEHKKIEKEINTLKIIYSSILL